MVWAWLTSRLRVYSVRTADGVGSGGHRRRNAYWRVFDGDAFRRRHPQAFRGLDVNVRFGLTPGNVIAAQYTASKAPVRPIAFNFRSTHICSEEEATALGKPRSLQA